MKFKKMLFLCLLATIVSLLQFTRESIYASEILVTDNFNDDTILVVLDKDSSTSFVEYTVNDFREVNCKKVEDLTEIYQEKIEKQRENFINKTNLNEQQKINVDTFRRILKITISNPGKQNVIDAIDKLKTRNDLESVEPDYFLNYVQQILMKIILKINGQSKKYNYQRLGILKLDLQQ